MAEREREHGRTPRRASLVLAGMAVGVLAATALGWWAAAGPPLPGFALSVDATGALIRSWGVWGVAGSIGLMIVHSFVPFPAEILALANGMVYGAVLGAVVTWVGAMLGAYLAFALARLFGRPFVKAVISGKRWERLEAWSSDQGGVMLLICRLIPVIAFNLINYAAGLTTITWWTFTWATGLGILPLTVLMAVMGAQMTTLPLWSWFVLVAAAAAAWLAWQRWRRRASEPAWPHGPDS